MTGRLAKLAIAVAFRAAFKVYSVLSSLCGGKRGSTLVVLTYHRLPDHMRTRFERQMDLVRRSAVPVPLTTDFSDKAASNYVAVTFDDAFQSVLKNAIPVLLDRGIPATIFVPTGYMGKEPGWIKNGHSARETVLTEQQLRELPQDLITVGSHTVSHMKLVGVSRDVAEREITESKKTLEEVLNKKVDLFAAPYATLDGTLIPLFVQAGYDRVFLNIPTFPATRKDGYVFGRTSVEPGDWPIEFRLKLLGAYQWLPLAIKLKNRLFGASKSAPRYVRS